MLLKSGYSLPFILLFYLLFNSVVAEAEKSVELQLRWTPSFQFAGFYAAQSQQYYQQNNLDVSIKSGLNESGELLSPIDEVMSGRADFGVDDLHLLGSIDKTGQMVILAPIMQKSPTALITRDGQSINKIHDLVGKTIKAPNNQHLIYELKVLLRSHDINLDAVKFIHGPIELEDLDSPHIDVLLTYGIFAEYSSALQNKPISIIHLSELGSVFYGNVLFTHKSLIKEQPELVNDFLKSSLKGWEYALKNKQQILNELNQINIPHMDLASQSLINRLYAEKMPEYMQWPSIEVGHSSIIRWHQIYIDLINNGLLNRQFNIDDYLYNPTIDIRQWGLYLLILFTAVISLFIVIRFNRLDEYRYVFVIGFSVIVLLYVLIEYNIVQKHQQTLKFEALEVIQELNTGLVNRLNKNVVLLKSLAAYIAVNPNLSHEEYKTFSSELFPHGEALINLAAAPDLIITMVYPLEGNEATIGVDYRNLSSQIELVLLANNKQSTVLSNSLQLIQGGRGLIIRQGVKSSNDQKPWGVVSAVVDINKVFEQVGFFKVSNRFNLVIESVGKDESNHIIYGNPYYVNNESPLSVTVRLVDNQWQFHISPVNGWTISQEALWLSRFLAALLVLIWFFRVRYLLERRRTRKLIHKEIRTHETLLHEVGSVAGIAGWRVNEQGDILQWTAKDSDVLVQHASHKLSHIDDFWDLFGDNITESLKKEVTKAALSGDGFDIEIPFYDNQEKKHWLRVVSEHTLDTVHGKEIIGAVQDITEYKNISELIQYQATHDNLTDLNNRSAFIHQTVSCLEQADEASSMVALIFIDLDNFKNINDTLGHAYGDKVLAEFSNIIKNQSEGHDVLGRYSGDEFVILTYNTSYSILKERVEELLQSLNQPLYIEGRSIFISVSIGVSVYPDHATSASELMVNADLAMYEAKKRGKNTVCFFNVDMLEKAQRQVHLKNALLYALETKKVEVYYQPIINIDSKKVIKIEALMRCPDASGGFYNTEELIQICEETSTIFDVDIAVLKQINDDIEVIKAECDGSTLGISLNVSPHIFSCQTQLFEEWLYWLHELADKTKVTLEITERALLNKKSKTMSIFKDFKKRGIEIAIDDFGVGYSSMITLVDFPISVIKIDRSFVNKLDNKESKYNQLISSIVSLASTLNLDVIAEGVENNYQVNKLKQYGCKDLQGYYFSKALNRKDMIQYILQPDWSND